MISKHGEDTLSNMHTNKIHNSLQPKNDSNQIFILHDLKSISHFDVDQNDIDIFFEAQM